MTDTTTDETHDETLERSKGVTFEIEADWSDWHQRDDGHTVLGRIVPFHEPTTVIDKGERFREQFLPGCLTAMCQYVQRSGNARWVTLNFDHDERFESTIGYARNIEQRDDGGWALFKLYPTHDFAKMRSMLEESHTGLSVMFDDLAPPKLMGGIRSRVQIGIRHVAATAIPAYTGAHIASVRETTDVTAQLAAIERPALDEWRTYLDSITRK